MIFSLLYEWIMGSGVLHHACRLCRAQFAGGHVTAFRVEHGGGCEQAAELVAREASVEVEVLNIRTDPWTISAHPTHTESTRS